MAVKFKEAWLEAFYLIFRWIDGTAYETMLDPHTYQSR